MKKISLSWVKLFKKIVEDIPNHTKVKTISLETGLHEKELRMIVKER